MDITRTANGSGVTPSRRSFLKGAIVAGAGVMASPTTAVRAQGAPGIRGFDHVSLPLRDTEAMLAFYRSLGLIVNEGPRICSVHFGDQKLNFHRPEFWQDPSFTARAPSAEPPCGDFCVVWEGSTESLTLLFERAGADVILGPVDQPGGRGGGERHGHQSLCA